MVVSGFMLKLPYLLYPQIVRSGVLYPDLFNMLGVVQSKICGIFSGVICEDYILMGCVAMHLCM
jgi:hypothetical protein